MSRRGKGRDDGYWPSYVDVLTNVVLNLMFLAAILVVGNFFQGLQSSGRTAERAAETPEARVAARREPPSAALVAQPILPVPDRGFERLSMRFEGSAVRLDEDAAERLKRELMRQREQGAQYWQVGIQVDVDDTLQRRAAYLRMMAVRSVFLEIGIEPQRFSLRMEPSPVGGVGSQLAWIVPRRKLPEGVALAEAPAEEPAQESPEAEAP